jgi:hypothetical protein
MAPRRRQQEVPASDQKQAASPSVECDMAGTEMHRGFDKALQVDTEV